MKNALTITLTLGLVASCTSIDNPPEGIIRRTAKTEHINLTLDGERYYGKYSMLVVQKGYSFKATRYSAIALSTDENLLEWTTVSTSDHGDKGETSISFEEELRDGKPLNVSKWQTGRTYLCGKHWYQFVPDRSVVVLSPDGSGARAIYVQLAAESYSSKSRLATTIKRELTASQ